MFSLAKSFLYKIKPVAGDLVALGRVIEIVVASCNKLLAIDHYKVFAWNQGSIALTRLTNDTTTIGHASQHPMPFEISLVGVVDVEQYLGLREQFGSFLYRKVAASLLRFGKAKRNQANDAVMLGEEWRVLGKEGISTMRHRTEKGDVVWSFSIARQTCSQDRMITQRQVITF